MSRIKTWEFSDEFWTLVEPLLPASLRDNDKEYKRKLGGGTKPKYSNRVYFSAIVYILRTGIQWNAIPKEKFEGLGSSALHDKFQKWAKAGFFVELWRRGLVEYDELKGIAWEWQSADSTNIEAPLALKSVGPNPTDRGKNGTKRNLLVDGNGVPLAVIVGGVNRHDSILLAPLLKARIINQPNEMINNLCLDAGYTGKENDIWELDMIPHIRPRGEEKTLIEKKNRYSSRGDGSLKPRIPGAIASAN